MLLIEGYKAFSLFRPEDRTNILLAPGGATQKKNFNSFAFFELWED
jgi:hypothetical protein